MNPITAYTDKTIISMTSREIAELTGKDLSTVHRDIRAILIGLYGDAHVEKIIPEHYRNRHSEFIRENATAILSAITGDDANWNHQDPRGFSWKRDNRGYITSFTLDKSHTMTLIAGYSVKLRKAIIDRWQELEGRTALPQNLPDALRLAADQAERAAKAESALALAAPKVQALDLIAADDKSLTVTQAAKVLGIKRDNLTNWLNANGWIYRQNGSWVAYQQHIQNGRLIYKEARYTDDLTGQETYRPYCHITSKGLVVLAEEFGGQELAA